jgi:hypothetical protein
MNSTTKEMDRRQFLKLTGCGAMIAVVGGGCSKLNKAEAKCPYSMTYDPYPGQCNRYTDSNGSGYCDYSETASPTATTVPPTATAVQPTATVVQPTTNQIVQPTATHTTVVQPSATSVLPTATATQSTVVQPARRVECNRGCRYPGGCHRYQDNNNTGICDRSEA